ncbi:MAG: lysophospholipid acyltransferase family protein [Myxococcota bacterium]
MSESVRVRDAVSTGALVAALAAIRAIPRSRALALGARLGQAWVDLGLPRTRVGLENLRTAFPDWSEERRRAVLRSSFANLGRSVVEIAHLANLSEENLGEVISLEGLEHLENARRGSRGVIALTAHFGNWELFAAAMGAAGFPLTIVYRGREPVLEAVMRGWRERGETLMVARGSAARTTLKALRAGRVVAMTLDQDTPSSQGVFVPFLGRLACTRDAPARIAMRTGAPVVPSFIFRRGEDARHVVRFAPALELVAKGSNPEEAVLENVRRMVRAVEDVVRECPEQWTWNHRRWRTQPPGETRPYLRGERLRARLAGAAPVEPEAPADSTAPPDDPQPR